VKNARNIAIILLLALGVTVIPGGGQAAQTALQAVYIAFLGTFGWFAALMYRQHRTTLYGLGDRRRAAVYISIGALVLVASVLWRVSGVTAVIAVVVAAAAIYTIFAIVYQARQY
jgi:hypothetical protein